MGKKDKTAAVPVEETKKNKSKGGSSDVFAKPSEAPATGEGWAFEKEENLGKLFLITPYREEEHDDSFNPGEKKKHIIADIVEINEKKPAKSELHADAWVFGGWTRGSLRGFMGERKVLARLAQDKSKARGKNIPWVLEDGDSADFDAAKEYLDSVDVFAQDKKKK